MCFYESTDENVDRGQSFFWSKKQLVSESNNDIKGRKMALFQLDKNYKTPTGSKRGDLFHHFLKSQKLNTIEYLPTPITPQNSFELNPNNTDLFENAYIKDSVGILLEISPDNLAALERMDVNFNCISEMHSYKSLLRNTSYSSNEPFTSKELPNNSTLELANSEISNIFNSNVSFSYAHSNNFKNFVGLNKECVDNLSKLK